MPAPVPRNTNSNLNSSNYIQYPHFTAFENNFQHLLNLPPIIFPK